MKYRILFALFAIGASACSSSSNEPTGGSGGSGGGAASSGSSMGTGGANAATTSTSVTSSSSATSSSSSGGLPGWNLTWSDEFNAPDGTAVDATKWTALVGGDGWGNQEREYYTNDVKNAHQEGGNLVITATTDGVAGKQCWYGACKYTSARLQTKDLFDQANGRFEARIQIPFGQGIWPAFWMLGNDIDSAGWPTCGEIDIMENIGKEPGTVHGSLHGPGYSGGSPLTGSYQLPGGKKLSDDFHIYAVEWEATTIRFYLDDMVYETKTSADVPAGAKWVYDHPFFMLLNVAVGGGWPGDPDGTTMFPQTMKVDYVRVYTKAP